MKSYVPKVEVEAEAEEVEPPAKKARTKTEKAEKVDKADPMVLCKNPPCNDSSKVDAKNAAADDSNDWSNIFACNRLLAKGATGMGFAGTLIAQEAAAALKRFIAAGVSWAIRVPARTIPVAPVAITSLQAKSLLQSLESSATTTASG